MAQDTFGVECPNPDCKRISYYDKRIVCTNNGDVVRRVIVRGDNNKELHKLYLKGKDCTHELVIEVDCEDYL
jgi:hypothetical protein